MGDDPKSPPDTSIKFNDLNGVIQNIWDNANIIQGSLHFFPTYNDNKMKLVVGKMLIVDKNLS